MQMGGSRRGASLEELRKIYESRLAELCRVAAAITGDRDGAPDVVHEAFVRAVRQRRSYDGRGALEGWVWRIVVNAARDARAARPDGGELPDGFGSSNEQPLDDPRWDLVRGAVEQLPDRQRLVLFLRYYADLDYRSIARVASIAEGTVAATLNAAHERLRQLVSGATL